MRNSKIDAFTLGEDKVISLTSKVGLTVRKDFNGSGLNQVAFGGVGLTHEDIDYNDKGSWEMLDCEIIIIPIRRRKIKESSSMRNAKIDMIMQILNDDKHWEDVKEEKKINSDDF